MGKKGAEGDRVNSKKAAGQARKAESAAKKAAEAESVAAAREDADWQKGSKSNAKKEAEAAKKAEQARKKAERDAQLDDEMASLPSRAGPAKSKTAVKKTRGLDLAQLDDDSGSGGKKLSALNASGIDNALDALSLTGGGGGADGKVDRHPERRFKAAYAAFEERRLREMDDDGTGAGLRLQQRKDRLRKEFEKSPENPFNQVTASYDATREDVAGIKEREKSKIEKRLGSS